MNVNESNAISKELEIRGAIAADNYQDADAIILNTCSVRSQAEQKAFSFLGRVQEVKEKNKNLKIAVIGCMAERIADKIKKRFNFVDLIIGAKDNKNAVSKILKLFSMQNTSANRQKAFNSQISSFVTIMKGCNNYCSYCIVPFVRGNETNLNYEDILNECRRLSENGTKEIFLLGQNVNSYNFNGLNFAGLIKKVTEIENIKRIRFMTSHPKDLNDSLIEVMKTEPKVCRHIHLPLQSASNKILEKMNRKYTYENYLSLIKKLRTFIPDIAITTDIIVGFPQETEKDFEETLNAVKEIRFDGLYVFKYSQRSGTKAAEFYDDVSLKEKQRRHSVILKVSNDISMEIVSQMTGAVQNVLAEKFEDGVLTARTRGGRKVFINGNKEFLGKEFDVVIKTAKINSLFGEKL
jgi:tRNA-2-methylthio-N6-dimethylallyladenosine synthase